MQEQAATAVIIVGYSLGGFSSLNLMFSSGISSFISWYISSEFSEVIRNRML